MPNYPDLEKAENAVCQKSIPHEKKFQATYSLRWHYPNQVMGQSNSAYSQPACYASSPFIWYILALNKNYVNHKSRSCLGTAVNQLRFASYGANRNEFGTLRVRLRRGAEFLAIQHCWPIALQQVQGLGMNGNEIHRKGFCPES